MLSFKNIATLATLAFGAMSVLAAPAPLAIELEAEIGTRDVAPTSIPKILDNVIVAVTPIVADLKFLTSANATVEAVTPIVDQIKTIINGAVDDVNKLAGQPVDVILATVEGTAQISTQDLAKVVADLLKLVFTALDSALGVVGSAAGGDVVALLGTVGPLLGSLLSAVLGLAGGLVGGLLSTVLGLVGDVSGVASGLGLGGLLSILNI